MLYFAKQSVWAVRADSCNDFTINSGKVVISGIKLVRISNLYSDYMPLRDFSWTRDFQSCFKNKYVIPGFGLARLEGEELVGKGTRLPVCHSALVFIVLEEGSLELHFNSCVSRTLSGSRKVCVIHPRTLIDAIVSAEGTSAYILAYGFDFLVSNIGIIKHVPDISGISPVNDTVDQYDLTEAKFASIKDAVNRLESYLRNKNHLYWSEMTRLTALELNLELADATLSRERTVEIRRVSRSRDIFRRFIGLLVRNVKEHRTVSYYADQLCISPKYLNRVVSQVTGRTASGIISETALMVSVIMLRDGSYTIKQIAAAMNFASMAAFSRFFKNGMGCSPRNFKYDG